MVVIESFVFDYSCLIGVSPGALRCDKGGRSTELLCG